jgi:hypothetical protein
LEKALLKLPWQAVRQGVDVKLLPKKDELYVLAKSHARILKERGIRRRKLTWLLARLKEISKMELRHELLMKLGASRAKLPATWRLVDAEVAPKGATFSYSVSLLEGVASSAMRTCASAETVLFRLRIDWALVCARVERDRLRREDE